MEREVFATIKKKYSRYSSFAIWNDNNLENVGIIEKNINILNPRIVIVGLNASGGINRDFGNFHCKHRGGRDHWLRKAFNHSVFRGAYMTDIIKNSNVSRMNEVDLSEKNKKLNVESLKKEIGDLQFENPIIISIGEAPANILKEYLSDYKIHKIPHYAKRGIRRKEFIQAVKKVEELIEK